MSSGLTPTAVLASTARAMRIGRRAMVGYGPFVMYNEAQIRQAVDDFNSGRFT
jgi:redox-sensitive bicupin YhaK (pirin superfamily)